MRRRLVERRDEKGILHVYSLVVHFLFEDTTELSCMYQSSVNKSGWIYYGKA